MNLLVTFFIVAHHTLKSGSNVNKSAQFVCTNPSSLAYHPHRYKFYDAEEVFYKTRGRYDRTHKWEEFVAEVNDRYGKLTDHFGQPIVGFVPQPGHLCRAEKVCTGEDYSTWWLNPLIANLPITKDLTGQQVYEEILKFFCRTAQPKDPSPQPEYTRIESAGFDLKTSFRHRK